MEDIEELQEAIRQLSSVGREIIADWLRDFMMEEDYRAAEPAAAHGARSFDEREEMTMTAWLRCDEVAVTYPAASKNEWQKSVFVLSACVRRECEHQGEVKVSVLAKDGKRYAVLPSPTRDIVTVEDADLKQQ